MINDNDLEHGIFTFFIILCIMCIGFNYRHIKDLEKVVYSDSEPIVQEEIIDNKEPNFKFDHFNEYEIVLEIVANSSGYTYYRDTVTDVMYIAMVNNGGLSVMVEPETGKPLTYTKYLELYKEK